MKEKYHIAITIDKSYSTYGAVMLFSLLYNNDPAKFHIHIIKDYKSNILEIPIKYVLKYFNCTHTFYLISKKEFSMKNNVVITHHISVATYYRLYLPNILSEIDKVLFLDSDIIIDGHIEELFNINIERYALAATVINNPERIKTLALTKGYFNAGVMMINLEYMRTHHYASKFIDFLSHNSDKIFFWDQDVLNSIAKDSFQPIAAKWNYIAIEQEYVNAPVILHYAGKHKPWDYHSTHPFKNKYFEYLNKNQILHFIIFTIQMSFRLNRKITKLIKR